MNSASRAKRHIITGLLAGTAMAVISHASIAALLDTPLFLVTSAENNIFLILDDSGSMNSEMLTTNDYNTAWGGVYRPVATNNCPEYHFIYGDGVGRTQSSQTTDGTITIHSTTNNNNCNLPDVIPGTDANWALLFSNGYNGMYYDPNSNYEPWPNGTDSNGNAVTYTNSDPRAARIDPRNAYPVANLTVTWPSLNNSIPMFYYNSTGTIKTPISFDPAQSLTAAVNKNAVNFANWFTYHRTRELAAKYSLAAVVRDSPDGLRMGLSTINANGKKELASIKTTAARNSLIGAIYSGSASGSTPLREQYEKVGNYFSCTGATPFATATANVSGNCGLDKTDPTGANNPFNYPAACSQNYAVIVTDGEYNNDNPTHTGDDDNDGTNTPTGPWTYYPNGSLTSTTSTFKFDQGIYGSTSSTTSPSTFADLAMYYYENDLAPSIPNRVPTLCHVDENPAQHLSLYALTLSLPNTVGTLPATHPTVVVPNTSTPALSSCSLGSTPAAPAWNDSNKVNDLIHATFNSRGKFYNATNTTEMVNDLKSALADISTRRAASSAVGLSSTANTNGTQVYISSFYSGHWYGELSAYSLSTSGVLSTTATWNAHINLDSLANSTASASRAIVSYNPSQRGIPFTWDTTKLTSAQQTDLNTDSNGVNDAHGDLRLSFIRGDHDCESNYTPTTCATNIKIFRQRIKKDASGNDSYTRLGDLINSAPVYVKEPVSSFPAVAPFPSTTDMTFSDYKKGKAAASTAFCSTAACILPGTAANNTTTRTPMVYIGGNDGMLHAFNASTNSGGAFGTNGGDEVFAYVPNALSTTGAGLHVLTELGKHSSYVDLTPEIADAYTATPTDATPRWRSILVGGLRHGGKGVYAIDVTDPNYLISATTASDRQTRAASKVMWEFTAADDIAAVPGSDDLGYTYSTPVIVPLKTSASTIDWFAVFGSGYSSGTNKAVLYLLKLSGPTGANGSWQLNTDYYRIALTGTSGGLSSPALIDTNGDGIYDRAYAGDLNGKLWAFNLSDATPSNWAIAYGTNGSPTPLFTTQTNQPITVKPTVVGGPGTTAINAFLLFGTGTYMADGDQALTSTQSFYGVWDNGTKNSISVTTDLVQQTLSQVTINGNIFRTLTNNSVDYGTKYGWYMDLPTSGERVVANAIFIRGADIVLFPSIIPSGSPCGGGGSSWLMAISPTTGTSPGTAVFDVNNNGVVDSNDNTTINGHSTVISGLHNDSLILNYGLVSYASSATLSQTKCPNGGAYVQGLGRTTTGQTVSADICVPGGSVRPGRYFWRQL